MFGIVQEANCVQELSILMRPPTPREGSTGDGDRDFLSQIPYTIPKSKKFIEFFRVINVCPLLPLQALQASVSSLKDDKKNYASLEGLSENSCKIVVNIR